MKIVIEIPEEIRLLLINNQESSLNLDQKSIMESCIKSAIINGIPLPKGHGRLIDAEKLEPRDISPEPWYSPMWGFELVDIEDAPTIIEADKEGEE